MSFFATQLPIYEASHHSAGYNINLGPRPTSREEKGLGLIRVEGSCMGSTLGSTFAPRKVRIRSELDIRDMTTAQMKNLSLLIVFHGPSPKIICTNSSTLIFALR